MKQPFHLGTKSRHSSWWDDLAFQKPEKLWVDLRTRISQWILNDFGGWLLKFEIHEIPSWVKRYAPKFQGASPLKAMIGKTSVQNRSPCQGQISSPDFQHSSLREYPPYNSMVFRWIQPWNVSLNFFCFEKGQKHTIEITLKQHGFISIGYCLWMFV